MTLTIGIPTYNRAHRIQKALESVCRMNSDKIEILICDNCSSDNTAETVAGFSDSRISYYKNDKNLGLVGNIIQVIRQSKSRYTMLMSDEDIIDAAKMDSIVNILATVDVSMAFCGVFSSLGNKVYRSYEGGTFSPGYQSGYRFSFRHGYMSGIILKKNDELIEKVMRLSTHPDCLYPHELYILAMLDRGDVLEVPGYGVIQGTQEEDQEFAGKVRPAYNRMQDRIKQTEFHFSAIQALMHSQDVKSGVESRLRNLALFSHPQVALAYGDSILELGRYIRRLRKLFGNILLRDILKVWFTAMKSVVTRTVAGRRDYSYR